MKKRPSITLLTVLLAMVFAAGIGVYSSYIGMKIYQESSDHLLESFSQISETFTLFVQRNWTVLSQWDGLLKDADIDHADSIGADMQANKASWRYSDFYLFNESTQYLTADGRRGSADSISGVFQEMYSEGGPIVSTYTASYGVPKIVFAMPLSRNLEQDSARRAKAMQVLHVMLSEDAQNRIVYEGQDLLSYSQNVSLRLTDYLEDVRPVVEQNHMYIRIASNDFFAVSKDVVSRMIAGEYTAKQAYQAFNAQLLADDTDTAETVLTSDKGYSNVFHADGGNASFSVMANTLRGVYDSDVLIAAANSFTGSVLAADYTEKQAASMIMPNGLLAYRRTMTGAELTETVRAFVEGSEDGFTPFNRGSLPAVSGIAIEVKEENGGFALTGVTRDGKPLQGDETVTVTCLATAKQMAPLLADESRPFEGGDTRVRDEWSAYAAGGSAALAEPEHYITLR